MEGNVLVDSSFFIERLRAGRDPFRELEPYSEDCDFLTCGVVTVEVLRGVKQKKAYDEVAALFGCMLYVPTLNRIWERANRLAWQLDREGRSMQVPDLTIAACALEAEAAVLTFDSDFLRVPELCVLRQLA